MPVYHGCSLRNRNGFNKRVDFKRGEQCVLPTNKPYWRRTKDKHKLKRVYNTRYQSEYNICYLSLVKELYYYNHRTKKYMHEDYWKKKIGFLVSCVRLCMTCVCICKDNLDKANITSNIRKVILSCFILSLILIVTLFFFYCITINITEKKLNITVLKNLFRWLHE